MLNSWPARRNGKLLSVLLRAKDQPIRVMAKPNYRRSAIALTRRTRTHFHEDQQGVASGALKGLAVFIALIMRSGSGFAE